MKVYISGAITGLEQEVYEKAFEDAEVAILKAGHEPVNPVKIVPNCIEACGSDKAFDNGAYQHTWKCYMKADIAALVECDAIVMLPDFADSKGARTELTIAAALDMPILGFHPLFLDDFHERLGKTTV